MFIDKNVFLRKLNKKQLIITSIVLFVLLVFIGGFVFFCQRYRLNRRIVSTEFINDELEEDIAIIEDSSYPIVLDFEVEFLDKPELVDKEFDFYQWDDFEDNLKYIREVYKTGVVKSGAVVNELGQEYDLSGYEVYFFFFNSYELRLLYSDLKPVQFVIDYGFYHPSSTNITYSLKEEIEYQDDVPQKGVVNLYSIKFSNIFGIQTLLQEESDEGYLYSSFFSGFREKNLDESDSLIPVDSLGENIIYLIENDDYYRFIMFSPEGFPQMVRMNIGQSLIIGYEIMGYNYSMRDVYDCRFFYPIYRGNTNELEKVGYSTGGREVYLHKDRDNEHLQYLYNENYLEGQMYMFNEIEEDKDEPFSYEEFVEQYPVVYVRVPFENIVYFVRRDFKVPCLIP